MKNLNLLIAILSLSFFLLSCGGDKNKSEEPNDTIEEATEIKLNQVVEFQIKPVGDLDWFKVEVPGNGYLKVSTQSQPENLNLECSFAVYEEWEQEKAKFFVKKLEMPAIAKVQKGTCYILINDDWNDAESDEKISMKVEFIEEFDKNEPNDRIEDATALELNTDFQMAIFPLKDIDWFKIEVETPGYVKLSLKNVDKEITPEVKFYKYDQWAEKKEIEISKHLELPAAVQINEPCTYYFAINDDWNNAYSQSLFDVRIEFIEEHDLQEPNNNFESAFELQSGDQINIAIFPVGDVDYFKITPIKNGIMSLKTKDVPQNINLRAKCFVNDAENQENYIEKSEYLSVPCEFSVEANIEYFFYIEDDWNDAASEKLFELKVEVE